MDLTEATIIQHLYWTNLKDSISTHIKVCKTCQKNKKQNPKYGFLTAKEAEAIPWDRLSVDIIGPYKVRREGHEEPLILRSLTMIYPITGWFKIVQYNDRKAAKISNLLYQAWICIYPH